MRSILGGIKRRLFPPQTYWEKRKNFDYYQRVKELVQEAGSDARSILDVGTGECEYLDWFDWIPRRVSVDLRTPCRSPGIKGIQADFLEWENQEPFDICLCLQVLEHIPDATRFAQKLLKTAPIVIVSVPHKWVPGGRGDHVHDPVDATKMAEWFARQPDQMLLVREPTRRNRERMICCYGHGHAAS
jgi:hypothetical protein